jgi:hypothetical protein
MPFMKVSMLHSNYYKKRFKLSAREVFLRIKQRHN